MSKAGGMQPRHKESFCCILSFGSGAALVWMSPWCWRNVCVRERETRFDIYLDGGLALKTFLPPQIWQGIDYRDHLNFLFDDYNLIYLLSQRRYLHLKAYVIACVNKGDVSNPLPIDQIREFLLFSKTMITC